MHKAIAAALNMNLDTVQVFVKNQRQWRARPFQPNELERWHELLGTPGVGPPLAHATYLINLASEDEDLYERSCRAFAEELLRCQTLAIPYLVVHPGAAGTQPRPRALERVAAALNRIFRDHPQVATMPLLETTAGQGTTLGRTFAELGTIIRRLDKPYRVGVCIDTCHVFAAGYDIRKPGHYTAMIAEAQREVGLERIHCWHLNDCKSECGTRLDRHAHIGRGQIGPIGFRNVLADPHFRGIPMIIETPKGQTERGRDWDRVNIQRLRTIAARIAPR
jgi:deoxyribonuclease-4